MIMLNGSNRKHVLIFIMAFFFPGQIVSTTRGLIVKKTCTDLNTMRVLFGISLESCVEECQRRKGCSTIMYRHGINECALKDLVEWSLLTENEPLCVYTSVTDRSRGNLGECSTNNCRNRQRCETVGGKNFKCITTECPTPHSISNADVFSKVHAVGDRNSYKCEKGYVGVGDPFIACANNGTWTSTNFTCVGRGNAPNKTYINGELVTVNGKKWIQGTVIHFLCRSGFQGKGTNATSMINGQGDWEPNVVQCCNDNSTEIWNDGCIGRFNGSSLDHRADMFSVCQNTGGYLQWLSADSIKSMFGSGEYLWLMSNNPKHTFEENFNLTICLAENMKPNELQDFTNHPYHKLVEEVVSRKFTGKNCDKAYWWAPGQPDGGFEENCIAFNYADFKMYDVRCDLNFEEKEHLGFVCWYSLPLI